MHQRYPTADVLPVDTETLEFHSLLHSDDLTVEAIKDPIVQRQFEEFLTSMNPEWLNDPSMSTGLEFEISNKMEVVHGQVQRSSTSPVIPLSVQQEQLDNIDPQALPQALWASHGGIDDCSQLSVMLADSTPVTTSCFQSSAVECHTRLSPEPTDQTVPFGRHVRLMPATDLRTETLCSVSSAAFTSPSVQATQLHAGRLPGADDQLSEKKQRRREQNRRAATKCRLKRREQFDTLKKNHDKVTEQNKQLKAQIRLLSQRHQQLQTQLAAHQQVCGVTFSLTNNSA